MRRENPIRRFLAGILLAGAGTAAIAALQEGRAPEVAEDSRQLVGVWGAQRDFGPRVDGALWLSRTATEWSAEIAGDRLPIESAGGILSFEVPGDGGRFRGTAPSGEDAIFGQWIQPGVVGAFSQRFSTPVRLVRVGRDRWRGEVRPLADAVHLFFVVEPSATGRVRAFLRNPEVNFGRFFDLTEVERRGSAVQFWGVRAGRAGAERQLYFEGTYRAEADRLSVFVEDLGGTYDLEPIAGDAESPFFPRAPKRAPYRYHPPVAREDGWPTASLDAVGMAVAPIEELVRKIVATPIDAIDAPAIDALLVARHGRLVVEEYFHGWGPDEPHDVRSASKSLTATLAGAAIRAGLLSLDSRLYEVMAGDVPTAPSDPRAGEITLEHLLTMSSGLACDDWDEESPGSEDRMQSQDLEPDWYRYSLALPMAHPPGEHAAYCSGGMNLAGGMVARAAGMPLTDYFDRALARPLQMSTYHTNLMPTGEAYAGGGLRITGRDFLKFGQLVLDDGVWNGRRLLDAGWSAAATAEHAVLGSRRRERYGYGWWGFDYELGERRWRAIYAGGNGGNYILVVPELDLDIVFLASNYNQAVMHDTKYRDVPEFLLRSVLAGEEEGGGGSSGPGTATFGAEPTSP